MRKKEMALQTGALFSTADFVKFAVPTIINAKAARFLRHTFISVVEFERHFVRFA